MRAARRTCDTCSYTSHRPSLPVAQLRYTRSCLNNQPRRTKNPHTLACATRHVCDQHAAYSNLCVSLGMTLSIVNESVTKLGSLAGVLANWNTYVFEWVSRWRRCVRRLCAYVRIRVSVCARMFDVCWCVFVLYTQPCTKVCCITTRLTTVWFILCTPQHKWASHSI